MEWSDQNLEGMRIKSKICCDESIRKKFSPIYHSELKSVDMSDISMDHVHGRFNSPIEYNMSHIIYGFSGNGHGKT